MRELYLARQDGASAVQQAFALADHLAAKEGDFSAAVRILGSLPMYALSADQRRSCLLRKAAYSYAGGSYDAAISFLAEAGVSVQVPSVPRKNPYLAMGLTVLVPAGFIYIDEPALALGYTLANAASVGCIAAFAAPGAVVAAILSGAYCLNQTYAGAHRTNAYLVQKYNSVALDKAKKEALELLLRFHLREEEDILNCCLAGHEHGKTVNSHSKS